MSNGSAETEAPEGRSQGGWQLDAGAQLGDRYRVVSRIGAGGMGEVYEVEHIVLGRHFAAKVLRCELAREVTLVSRFASEVKAMARLRSDHVAQIVDTGTLANGTPYFVMERLIGHDLKTILRRSGSLAPHRAVRLVIDACWGLQAVHAAGLVHRDIKPSNLFIAKTDSGDERCVLLDFGVTKSCDTTHTRKGQLVGTLQYMAPEQLECGKVDSRTDLYALGAVLYECLAGLPPHKGETLEQVLYGIMSKEAPPLWKQRPEISENLSALVGRAISRNPTDRFEAAKAMAYALQPHSMRYPSKDDVTESATLSVAANQSGGSRHSRSPRTRRFLVWRGFGLALAGVSLLSVVSFRSATPTAPAGNPSSKDGRKMDHAPDALSQDPQIPRPAPTYPTIAKVSPPDAAFVQEEPEFPAKVTSERPARQRGTSRARQNPHPSIIDAANPYDK